MRGHLDCSGAGGRERRLRPLCACSGRGGIYEPAAPPSQDTGEPRSGPRAVEGAPAAPPPPAHARRREPRVTVSWMTAGGGARRGPRAALAAAAGSEGAPGSETLVSVGGRRPGGASWRPAAAWPQSLALVKETLKRGDSASPIRAAAPWSGVGRRGGLGVGSWCQ